MKINREGKSKVLDTNELDLLLNYLPTSKHKLIAQVCRKTACRISEAIQLRYENVTKEAIFFPKAITKAKLKSRYVPINEDFYNQIMQFKAENETLKGQKLDANCYLFSGRYGTNTHLSVRAFQKALKAACIKGGIIGFSSHGFRRSSLTSASNKNIPIAHLAKISGHSNMQVLQEYLDCSETQLREAVQNFG
tara:strand:+ start:958 stop:1536 length:579 start_codon:yes stop_codon:yes gene_type:complete